MARTLRNDMLLTMDVMQELKIPASDIPSYSDDINYVGECDVVVGRTSAYRQHCVVSLSKTHYSQYWLKPTMQRLHLDMAEKSLTLNLNTNKQKKIKYLKKGPIRLNV